MDQNKIDQLFREKMDNLEVMPSIRAWSQVEKQIRSKNSFKVYWAAAAVVLIFASWILWPSQAELDQTPIASEVSYPPIESLDFAYIKIKATEKVVEIPKRNHMVKKAQVQLIAKQEEIEIQPIVDEIVPIEIGTTNAVAVAELDHPEIIEEVIDNSAVDFSTVKIIYIASGVDEMKEELQKADSANAFKKFITFAEKIDPGEMMAEFKSAKDNLLNKGFKKKDKNSF